MRNRTRSRLHDRIAGSCGNAFLAKELSRLKTLFRAFRDVAWAHDEARNDCRRLAEESREHLAIVEGLAAEDARAAARAMSRHIMGGAKYWSRVLLDGLTVTSTPSKNDSPVRRRVPCNDTLPGL